MYSPRIVVEPSVRQTKLPKLQYLTHLPTLVTCRVCRGEKIVMIKHSDNYITTEYCPACKDPNTGKGTGIQDNTKLKGINH